MTWGDETRTRRKVVTLSLWCGSTRRKKKKGAKVTKDLAKVKKIRTENGVLVDGGGQIFVRAVSGW